MQPLLERCDCASDGSRRTTQLTCGIGEALLLRDRDPGIADDRWLTVLLWFHGHFIKDIAALFYKEDTKLLSSVLGSKKRIVVVAPHLGWFKTPKDTDYNAAVLGKGEIFLAG